MNKPIKMERKEFIKEHSRLTRILEKGKLSEREAEAERQRKELGEIKKGSS